MLYTFSATIPATTPSATSAPPAEGGAATDRDDWYLYDAENRGTTAQGDLDANGHIVRGVQGVDVTYTLAGERASETRSVDGVATTGDGGSMAWTGLKIERFAYDASGALSSVSVSTSHFDVGAGRVVQDPLVLQAKLTRDALGRVVDYREYGAAGAVTFSQVTTYGRDGLGGPARDDGEVELQVSSTAGADGSTQVRSILYDYYATGELQAEHQDVHTITADGEEGANVHSDTGHRYVWDTQARESLIFYNTQAFAGQVQSTFDYDAAHHLVAEHVNDGTQALISYTTNGQGQVLSRREAGSGAQPLTFFYLFEGMQVGEVTNDGRRPDIRKRELDFGRVVHRNTRLGDSRDRRADSCRSLSLHRYAIGTRHLQRTIA